MYIYFEFEQGKSHEIIIEKIISEEEFDNAGNYDPYIRFSVENEIIKIYATFGYENSDYYPVLGDDILKVVFDRLKREYNLKKILE
jgi:hypothetical protein